MQAIQAGQVTVEDLLMSDMRMPPLKVGSSSPDCQTSASVQDMCMHGDACSHCSCCCSHMHVASLVRCCAALLHCAWQVVGWEGVIGSIVMLGGVLPLLEHSPFDERSGMAEDTAGSWCMVRSNRVIAGAAAGQAPAHLSSCCNSCPVTLRPDSSCCCC